MPVHVDIRINDQHIRTLHIGREEQFIGENIAHHYLVTGEEVLPLQYGIVAPDWSKGHRFSHVYSDGLGECVRKGIEEFEKHEKL